MAIQGVQFRPPDPYPLPEHFAEHLLAQPEVEAVRMVTQLLVEHDCAELVFIERLERDGQVRVMAAAGADPAARAAAMALLEQSGQTAYTLTTEPGHSSVVGAAIQAGAGMLFMGEVAPDEPSLPHPALRQYLTAGPSPASLGFYYVNPIIDAAGTCHGAVTLRRSLAAGFLNHDQPALVRALVLLLAENLAGAPVI